MHRLLLLAALAVPSLGCMGMVNGITGMDLEMATEADSVHPADFVVTAPVGGEKVMSMAMTAGQESLTLPDGVDVELPADVDYRLEMIIYNVTDADADLKTADSQLTAAGFTLQATEQDAQIYTGDQQTYVILPDSDEQTLVLIRVRPADTVPAE